MREKRALIISYHFYPEPVIGARRPTELAKSLSQAGWKVDVMTKRLSPEEEIRRSGTPDFGRVQGIYKHPGILGPSWRFLKKLRGNRFAATAAPELSRVRFSDGAGVSNSDVETVKSRIRRNLLALQALLDATKSWVALGTLYLLLWRLRGRGYELVLSSSPPASGHLLGLVASKLFGALWIADLRDPISQWDAVVPECKSRLRFAVENYLEALYMRNANRVVVTTPSLSKELSARYFAKWGQPVPVIYNGFDRPITDVRKSQSKELHIVYAGALYLNRDPLPFFEAISRLRDTSGLTPDKISFYLYGDCERWNGVDLRHWIQEKGLEDFIQIKGFLSQKELEPVLEEADVLVNFAQNQPRQIPAKTFDYLAYQAVILVISESESDTASFIRENHLGYVVESDPEKIASVLNELLRAKSDYRDPVKVDASQKLAFSRESQNKRYVELCEACFSGGVGEL